jgi:hypothetical protein
VCVSLGSKAIVEISSLKSLLVLCVSLSLYVCLFQRDLRKSSSVENTRFVRSLRCEQHARDKEEDG